MPRCPLCDHTASDVGAPCPQHPQRRLVDEAVLKKYPNDELLGYLVDGRFAITDVIGEGGMGYVYQALQEPVGRVVAVKALRGDHLDNDDIRERFVREAKIMGRLNHPNLVTLYHFDKGKSEDGQFFIVMEFVQGETLKERLEHSKPFNNLQDLLFIARGIIAGAAEAHANNIIHRDLKPANIILIPQGSGVAPLPKILDFGIARLDTSKSHLTRTGMVFGTPAYMSPEQAMGTTDVGAYTDVYAFGVILYQMLTGQRPFESSQPLQLLFAHANKAVPPIQPRLGIGTLPLKLIDLCMRCLAKAPADRPANAGDVIRDLDEVTTALTATSTASSRAPSLALAPPVGRSLALAPPVRTSLALAPPVSSSLSKSDAKASGDFAPSTSMLASIASAGFKASNTHESPAAPIDPDDPLQGAPTQAMTAIPVFHPPPLNASDNQPTEPNTPPVPTPPPLTPPPHDPDATLSPLRSNLNAGLDARAKKQLMFIGAGVAVLLVLAILLTILLT